MQLSTRTIGRSVTGRAIEVMFTSLTPRILLVGGLHGDETEGIMLGNMLLAEMMKNHPQLLNECMFLPILNPDGFALHQRWNTNGVDLNRNFPTQDWTSSYTNPRYLPGRAAASEPEAHALANLIAKTKFDLVIELHSYKDSVLMPFPVDQSERSAMKSQTQIFSDATKLPICWWSEDLGYTITGGLHTFCRERGVDNFTIEVEKGIGQFAIRERLLNPSLEFVRSYREATQSSSRLTCNSSAIGL